MNNPRLTVGIPTLGARPDRLLKAVASALGGSCPARVHVADQSEDGSASLALGPYLEHPMVRVIPTHGHARCLWDNWCLAAESCETEFFAWLQDDDIIAPHFGRRIVQAFDRFPRASAWIARLAVSTTEGTGNWWGGCGPMVPMDLMTGGPVEVRGSLVAAAGYFSSFALSPGVAFRATPGAMAAVRRVPANADLFAERSVLAELGGLGPVVCDPAVVGYWVQHESNESKFQNAAGGGLKQYPVMAAHLHGLLAESGQWEEALGGWALCVGDAHLRQWLTDTAPHAGLTPTLDRARDIFASVCGVPLERFREAWEASEKARKEREANATPPDGGEEPARKPARSRRRAVAAEAV